MDRTEREELILVSVRICRQRHHHDRYPKSFDPVIFVLGVRNAVSHMHIPLTPVGKLSLRFPSWRRELSPSHFPRFASATGVALYRVLVFFFYSFCWHFHHYIPTESISITCPCFTGCFVGGIEEKGPVTRVSLGVFGATCHVYTSVSCA